MAGLFLSAMNDDEGYAFLRLGRAIERRDFAARVLLHSLEALGDGLSDDLRTAEWVGVLRSLTAYQMYRRSVRGTITRTGVLRFLAGSPVFPRSLAFCALETGRALDRLPHVRAAAELSARLFEGLSTGLAAGQEPPFARLVQEAQAGLAALHDAVAAAYFVPVEAPGRQLRMQAT